MNDIPGYGMIDMSGEGVIDMYGYGVIVSQTNQNTFSIESLFDILAEI